MNPASFFMNPTPKKRVRHRFRDGFIYECAGFITKPPGFISGPDGFIYYTGGFIIVNESDLWHIWIRHAKIWIRHKKNEFPLHCVADSFFKVPDSYWHVADSFSIKADSSFYTNPPCDIYESAIKINESAVYNLTDSSFFVPHSLRQMEDSLD